MSDADRFLIPPGVLERLRNAVFAIQTRGDLSPVTVNGEIRDAILGRTRHLEVKFNNGEPFPERTGELRRGRPRGQHTKRNAEHDRAIEPHINAAIRRIESRRRGAHESIERDDNR